MNIKITSKHFLTLFSVVAMIGVTTSSLTNTGGPNGGITAAPGEGNCTSCHPGTLQTSGTNYNNMSFSGNFTGGGYIPDSTYTITLSYTHSGKSKFGFQLTCLDNGDAMAGSFTNTSTQTSIKTSTILGGVRSYMSHTGSGTSGSGSKSWSFSWTAPSANVDTLTVYAVVNATNSNSGTSGDIIIAREFKIAPSTLLPEAMASVSPGPQCQGKSVTLNGSGTNSPLTYYWTISGASPSVSSSQNPTVVFSNPGNFNAILKVGNSKGLSKPDTVVISVLPAPNAFISGGNNQKFCMGDSILLITSVVPGANYLWSNSDSKTNEAWITDTGNVHVLVVNSVGCVRQSNVVRIDYFDSPSTTLSSSLSSFGDSTCAGDIFILEADEITFDSFYFYENGNLLSSIDTGVQHVLASYSTLYGLQVKDANGCLSDTAFYSSNVIGRLDAPSVKCSASSPTSLDFQWTSIAGHQGFQISTDGGASWSTPSSGSIGTSHSVTGLSPEDSVTLLVRGLDGAPCFTSLEGTKKCYTESCSPLSPTVAAASAVCRGDQWTIEVNGLSGESYGLSIDGGAVFTDTIFSFQPAASRNYTLSIQDSAYLVCPSRNINIPVLVDNLADISLKPQKVGAYCPGDVVMYTANDSIENFNFYVNHNLVQSGANSTFESGTLEAGDSIFVVASKGTCIDTSDIQYVNIETGGNALFSFTRSHTLFSFTPINTAYDKYTWDFGDGSALSNDVSPDHDYADSEGAAVIVKLEVETVNECVYDSTLSITLPMFSSVEVLKALGVSIYPNPTDDILFIKNTSGKSLSVKLLGVDGSVIQKKQMNNQSTLDVSALSSGVYILEVDVNGVISSLRVVKK